MLGFSLSYFLMKENHRINYCGKYREINLYNSSLKIDFNFIYSENAQTVDRMLDVIIRVVGVE